METDRKNTPEIEALPDGLETLEPGLNLAPSDNPSPSGDTPRPRKPGAPVGNQNAFRSGVGMMRKALKGRRTPRARKLAYSIGEQLIADLGGRDSISEQQKIIVGIIGNQCGRYDMALRAHAKVIRKLGPRLTDNMRALSQLDNYLRPLENSIVSNMEKIGLERKQKAINLHEILSASDDDDKKTE